MKVLYVLHNFLPEALGGVELHTYHLAKEISKTDKIRIFCGRSDLSRDDYTAEDLIYDGIEIRQINYTWRDYNEFKMVYINKKIEREFSKFLDSYQPDVVDIHHLTGLSTTIINSIKERKIPLVLSLHDYWMICPKGQRIKDDDLTLCETIDRKRCASCLKNSLSVVQSKWHIHKLFSRIFLNHYEKELSNYDKHITTMLKLPDIIITPTEFFRKEFINYGVSPEKIKVIGYGLNTELFENVSREPSEKIRFGYIGSVIPSKGVHVLVEAFNKFEREDVSLSIYGEIIPFHGYTGYGDRLENLIEPGKDVTFYGGYDNEDIAKVLSKIDILVIPSIWHESFSIVIREGFLARIPVIASKLGAMEESIENGKTGLLFEYGNPNDLFEKMKMLVEDTILREKLSNNNDVVKNIRENAQELVTLYKELIASKNYMFIES